MTQEQRVPTLCRVDLRDFYERSYSASGAQAERFAAWRELSARAKADHILTLTGSLWTRAARVLDIGCGDGALIARLRKCRPQWELSGVEIAARAVELARARCPDAEITLYDGAALPFESGHFDLGILSHVLEHVPDPVPLLREAARVSRLLVIEVPLEANISTHRESRRQIARDVGHIQRFSRTGLHALIGRAGLRVTGELSDPLGRDAHAFFAGSRAARTKAQVKWGVRAGTHALSPRAAQRLFTVHYACACEPLGSPSASRYAASVS
jgi:SAM-dependent methyltransferase